MDKLLHLKADHTSGNLSSVAEQETRQLRTSAHPFSVYIHGDKSYSGNNIISCMWVYGKKSYHSHGIPTHFITSLDDY